MENILSLFDLAKVFQAYPQSFINYSIPVFQFPFVRLHVYFVRGWVSPLETEMMSTITNPTLTLCEIKVTYTSKVKISDRIKISSSACVAQMFRNIWSDHLEFREECNILLLNRANHVMGWFNVSIGGVASTVVDPKVIFSVALKCNASGIILSHNHPSGNLNPSDADLNLTKKLNSGGKLLEINILDHLILTTDRYYSFADEGML